jgi:hypothetical protein
MLPFLKEEKVGLRTQLTFTGSKMEIYVPVYYYDVLLESKKILASIIGRRVETIGMFWFLVGDEFYELQLPVLISFDFTESKKVKKKLKPGMPEIEFEMFTLTNGNAFIYDVNHKENVEDIVNFIQRLIEGAKLPPTLSYEEVLGIYLKALEVTIGSKLGIASVTLEFILSEIYRDRRNNSEPFRLKYDGKTVSPYDYKMLRIVKVPEMNSTFTGLTGEDITQQLISAVLRNREGKTEKVSPIERIIKY